MFIVALTNEYLKNIPNAPDEVNKEQFTAEARFCRALAYYTLMDMFGIPPFITEQNYSINPIQKSRIELFDWIENELLSIKQALPSSQQGEYGRADQAVIDALLARMYLNAEVYTGIYNTVLRHRRFRPPEACIVYEPGTGSGRTARRLSGIWL
jgi:hypothetical protein